MYENVKIEEDKITNIVDIHPKILLNKIIMKPFYALSLIAFQYVLFYFIKIIFNNHLFLTFRSL